MFCMLFSAIFGITINGPMEVSVGDLAIFTTDTPGGKWIVLPDEARSRSVEVLLPDGKGALIFASRKPMVVTLVYVTCGSSGVQVAQHTFRNVDKADPDPPPPNPNPNPPPMPKPPFTLLWIEESSKRSPAQAAAQNSARIRSALATVGWAFRVIDKDIVNEHGVTPPELKPYIDDAKSLGLPRLYIIGSDRRSVSLPAPSDESAFVNLLKELGLSVPQGTIETSQYRRVTPIYRSVPSTYCYGGTCIIVP